MPVVKVTDLAYGRLRSPDLDKQEEFLTAFNEANGLKVGRKSTRKATGRKATNSTARKPRVNISDDRRAQIVKSFKDGMTAPEAVTKYDISLATAQNIKKEAGMVNARS